ncbi:MAG TPA: type II toxin-antitoxin system HicA family toxin [bacterium]|nr:type II toxin-antitoxin system HicA family toxin [bacterium]
MKIYLRASARSFYTPSRSPLAAKLPVLSGEELIRALKKAGFVVVRRRGSHVSLRKGTHRTVVPLHDDLGKGNTTRDPKSVRTVQRGPDWTTGEMTRWH